jgi:galactokinase
MINSDTVVSEFQKLYRDRPLIVRSPGRINLLGEHTDYNLGFVLPAAIDKALYFAFGSTNGRHCRIRALDMNDTYEVDLQHLDAAPKTWANYLIGVLVQLTKNGHDVRGFNCVFGGDIPIGAGMSSSAALETGFAFGLNELFQLGIDRLSLVKMAQKAENEFVGVQCGIMDQYANAFGRIDTVLRLDCRSLDAQYYPFKFQNISILLFDTRVSHSLASTEYNRRRMECAEAVRLIRNRLPAISALRDVQLGDLRAVKPDLENVLFRRVKYVVEENERVLRACAALEHNDVREFGTLMKETHRGLRDEYQVSCPELDFLVDTVASDERVYGSRMMGGGFGGCTINLVNTVGLDGLISEVGAHYKKQFGVELKTYVTKIAGGTEVQVRSKDPSEVN